MSKLSVNADDVNRLLLALIPKLSIEIVDIDEDCGIDVKIKLMRLGLAHVLVKPQCENGQLLINLKTKLLMINLPKMLNQKLVGFIEQESDGYLIQVSEECLQLNVAKITEKLSFSIHFNQSVLKNKFIELDFSLL